MYEPYLQPGGQNAIVHDTWQSWNTLGSGEWWSTHTATGNPVSGTPETIFKFQTWSWSTFMTQFPDAVIIGGLGFNVGSGWTGSYSGNADALAVGVSGSTTTYDFEPDASVCKDGGWQTYGFKNQGDCVSYVVTGGRNG